MDSNEKKIPILSEEYMDEHWDELDHKEVSYYQKMSVDFITRHNQDIDFTALSTNPFITFEILDKFSSRISWATISINGKMLSDTFLANYYNKLYWNLILSRQQLNLKLLITLSEIYRKSRANNKPDFWKAISRYQKFDADYVKSYKRFLDFSLISENPYLSEDVIDQFLAYLDIGKVLKTHTIPIHLMAKYRDIFETYLDPTTKA